MVQTVSIEYIDGSARTSHKITARYSSEEDICFILNTDTYNH